MRALLLADMAARRRMLVGLAAGTALFVVFFASIEAFGGLSEVATRAFGDEPPSAFAAIAGSRSGVEVFTPLGLLAFAYNHPFYLALTLAAGVSIGARSVAGEVESGRAQLWFVRPVARARLLRGRLLFWLAAQVWVILAGLLGGTVGSLLADDLGGDGVGVAVRASVQYLPLALFVGAVAFAASAFAATRGRALSVAVGVTFAGYLANFASLLWSGVGWLRWITPFGYYDPVASVSTVRWGDVVVLLAGALVLVAVAHVGLERRDLT